MLRGKVNSGLIKLGDEVDAINQEGELVESFKVTKIYKPHFMDNV